MRGCDQPILVRSRPSLLARYSARSARWYSSAGVRSSASSSTRPALKVTRRPSTPAQSGWSWNSPRRRAHSCAASSRRVSLSSSANSSPPVRAGRSESRQAAAINRATSTSTASPMLWLWRSLTSVK
ncbi:hypothetical protein G6F22_018344 [Rhizopus arrhizus]|nr:hypothetical protein G6F22_018344 [Rhizopus arrhizus]